MSSAKAGALSMIAENNRMLFFILNLLKMIALHDAGMDWHGKMQY
jgi:hypothetical protein